MAFMSALTYGIAKSRVSRSIGGQGGSSILAAAGDAIQEAINEWNYRKNWNWTITQLANITVVPGTSDYALMNSGLAQHKATYDVRLLVLKKPLGYIDQREWDKAVADQTVRSSPHAYTEILTAGAPMIRFLPTPADPDTAVVKYFRMMNVPTLDADTLDIPVKYENGFVWLAKSIFLADRDAENARTGFWSNKAEAEITRCMADDETVPDRVTRFIPSSEQNMGAIDPTMPAWYLRDDYSGW